MVASSWWDKKIILVLYFTCVRKYSDGIFCPEMFVWNGTFYDLGPNIWIGPIAEQYLSDRDKDACLMFSMYIADLD